MAEREQGDEEPHAGRNRSGSARRGARFGKSGEEPGLSRQKNARLYEPTGLQGR